MVSKVSRATEKAREQVEGIVLLARAATLLVLLNAVMAVLVVDLASLFVAKDFVGFGDISELFVDRIITTGSC